MKDKPDFVVRGSLLMPICGLVIAGFVLFVMIDAAVNPYSNIDGGWQIYVTSAGALALAVWFCVLSYFSKEIRVYGDKINFRHQFNRRSVHGFGEITRIEVREVRQFRKGNVQYITLFVGDKAVVQVDSTLSPKGFKLFTQRLDEEIAARNIPVEQYK